MRSGENEASIYDQLGGAEGVRRLAQRFYDVMDQTKEAATIRAMHQGDLAPIIDKLSGFLSGMTGGPRDYFDRHDAPCIMSVHARYAIGAGERDQWLACMRRALEEQGVAGELRVKLEIAFARLAEAMRSS